MKITFITPFPSFGGGMRAVATYADELAKLGHEVRVVSAGSRVPSLKSRLIRFVKGQGWWRRPVPRSHLDAVPNITCTVTRDVGPIAGKDVPDGDVVIATWWETAEWVARLPGTKGVPVYFVQHHEVVFNNQPTDRVAATYRLPMAKVCCAAWLRDLMKTDYGDPTAAYVPYGVDHNRFYAPRRGKQKRTTVGFMYARASFKDVETAIKACELARRSIPDLRVIAFGELDHVGSEIPLPDWIEFELQPSQKRIAEIYASADAWLFSSTCEGFGLPILEAMACRTPIIGTPTGIAPEVIASGGGIGVSMRDPQAMANAIVRVCRMSDAQWRQLSDAAVEIAGRFQWDVSARAFESVLRTLVQNAD